MSHEGNVFRQQEREIIKEQHVLVKGAHLDI